MITEEEKVMLTEEEKFILRELIDIEIDQLLNKVIPQVNESDERELRAHIDKLNILMDKLK